jgi:hypothetical protein
MAGTVMAFDVVGLHKLSDDDFKTVKLARRFAGSPYTILGGTLGKTIDDDYGFETGVTAGEFSGILIDINDVMKMSFEHDGSSDVQIHVFEILKELRELPSSSEEEHVRPGAHIWAAHLNPESMTKDMLEQGSRVSRPAVQIVTDRAPTLPSEDNAAAQIKLDRHIFETPPNPIYSPQATEAAPVPASAQIQPPAAPQHVPTSPTIPAPIQAPRAAAATATYLRDLAAFVGYLMPEFLGGNEPSDEPPYSAAIPEDNGSDASNFR